MSDQFQQFARALAQGEAEGFKRRLMRGPVAEAPPDLDAQAPMKKRPSRASLIFVVGLNALIWAAIVMGVADLLS